MRLDTLRMFVGFSIIASHLLSVSLMLFNSYLTPAEKSEVCLLLGPIFTVYVTAIVRRFLTLGKFDSTPVHPALAILGIGIALIFSVAVPVVIWSFEAGRIGDFTALKSFLGIIEMALGAYTGALVDRLFGTEQDQAGRAAP